MSGDQIAIGSRGSALALVQAKLVLDAFEREGQPCRIVIVETDGDRRVPDTAWGEGAFVAALESALLDGRVDVAVHSAKDMPTDADTRLQVAAYLARADPRDALVVRVGAREQTLADLPAGARVGTDSPRRAGFVLARRPDLVVHPLHGNVDTRLRRLDAGETDALVLACAGLDRLGLADRIVERLEPEIVPPAPGQGAIALQARSDDAWMLALAATIDDRSTRRAVEAERTFLRASGGGCRAPIGALATIVGGELDLLGGHANPDGSWVVIGRGRGPVACGEDVARGLAIELDPRSRVAITGGPEADGSGATRRRVLVTRAAAQAGELVMALRDVGFEAVQVPAIAVEVDPPGGDLDRALAQLHTYRWVVVTSANGARAILAGAGRSRTELGAPAWAVIGPATGAILERAGIEVHFQPNQASSGAIAAGLPVLIGDRVLVVRGDLADGNLADALRVRGAAVDDVIAYRTREAPQTSGALIRQAFRGAPLDAVLFTSGSTVRGLLSLAFGEGIDVTAIPAVCIGPGTADEATRAGFQVLAVAATAAARSLALTTAQALTVQPRETS